MYRENLYKDLKYRTRKKNVRTNFLNIENTDVLISIVTDIAYHNPRTYSISSAILNKLFCLVEDEEGNKKALSIIRKVFNKFGNLPNTGHMQIWLQRAAIKIDNIDLSIFDEKICKLVNSDKIELWNNEWLPKIKYVNDIFNKTPIIDHDKIEELGCTIEDDEVLLFIKQYP